MISKNKKEKVNYVLHGNGSNTGLLLNPDGGQNYMVTIPTCTDTKRILSPW